MKSPVSVVIPVYNRESTLERTLCSIDEQRVKPAYVVLVDNGSTDRSVEIISKWAEGKNNVTVVSESTKGACAARNRGLAEVRSDFVCFFDSDDVMLPEHIREFSEIIAQNPEGDIFGRNIIVRLLDGTEKTCYFSSRSPMFNHLFRSSLSTGRIVVRTELVRLVGGWDESLTGWDDYELGVRLLLVTDKVVAVPGKPSVVAFQQAESLTGTDFSSHPERWERALDKVREMCLQAGRNDLLKWIDARAMILAAQYALEARVSADGNEMCPALELAEALRKKILARTPYPVRMRMIYVHNLWFKRLTWLMARVIFPLG